MTDLGVSPNRGKNAHTGALGGFLKAVDAGYVERGSYLLIETSTTVHSSMRKPGLAFKASARMGSEYQE